MATQFAYGQLLKALEKAELHEDPGVRKRAVQGANAWKATIEGMQNGSIVVGSRQPVTGFPPWVTPRVGYGGFARGPAGAYVDDDERALFVKIFSQPSTPAEAAEAVDTLGEDGPRLRIRRRLFSYYLSDEGLAGLYNMLDTGAYTVHIPEHSALLTVAWLLRAQDLDGADHIIQAIRPLVDHLRFAPIAAPPASERVPVGYGSRRTAKEAQDALLTMRTAPEIETMRTVLSVWNPISDHFLALWYPRLPPTERVDPRIPPTRRMDAQPFTKAWKTAAQKVLKEYDTAIDTHGPHSRRRTNLAWLVQGTMEALHDGELCDRTNGRVRTATRDMVRKRGAPGSHTLNALRTEQAQVAAIPSSRKLGEIVAKRLGALNPDEGIERPDNYAAPITLLESQAHGVPNGYALPRSVLRILRSAHAAHLAALLAEGLIPSAEVYAFLLPKEVCRLEAGSYVDDTLGRLMAANYDAFANRRSLLLLNYEHQVRLSELPWVVAASKHRTTGEYIAAPSRRALLGAAHVMINHWPGTLVPNAFVAQLRNLAEAAAMDIPFVEELAVDIFMGDFSPKYARAAGIAADVLQGTLYAKYYNIDTSELKAVTATGVTNPLGDLCRRRIQNLKLPRMTRFTVLNGEVCEQGQILTTHNLATFVSLGVTADWFKIALDAWRTCHKLLLDASGMSHPLGTIKNAAYAWRQALFFVSMAERDGNSGAVDKFQAAAKATIPVMPAGNSKRRVPRWDLILHGLGDVVNGSTAVEGRTPRGLIFMGWSRGPHWVFSNDEIGHKSAPEPASDSKPPPYFSVNDWEANIKAQYQGWTEAQ